MDAYEKAAELAPSRPAPRKALAQIAFHHGDLSRSKYWYAEVVRLEPGYAESVRIGSAKPGDVPPPGETTLVERDGPLRDYVSRLDLHVFDDCLEDPEGCRAWALDLAFEKTLYEAQNFPGIQTPGQPCQPIMDAIASILGKRLRFASPDNGAVRISFRDSSARTDIHVDDETGNEGDVYAAVLYLNPASQCRGGTLF